MCTGAYFGRAELREDFIRQADEHRVLDRYRQQFGYWARDAAGELRGCGMGCLAQTNAGVHGRLESMTGIPRQVCKCADVIFERLPFDEARQWPGRFVAAPRPGADLSRVFYQFMGWLLRDGIAIPAIALPLGFDRMRVYLADRYDGVAASRPFSDADWQAVGREIAAVSLWLSDFAYAVISLRSFRRAVSNATALLPALERRATFLGMADKLESLMRDAPLVGAPAA